MLTWSNNIYVMYGEGHVSDLGLHKQCTGCTYSVGLLRVLIKVGSQYDDSPLFHSILSVVVVSSVL